MATPVISIDLVVCGSAGRMTSALARAATSTNQTAAVFHVTPRATNQTAATPHVTPMNSVSRAHVARVSPRFSLLIGFHRHMHGIRTLCRMPGVFGNTCAL